MVTLDQGQWANHKPLNHTFASPKSLNQLDLGPFTLVNLPILLQLTDHDTPHGTTHLHMLQDTMPLVVQTPTELQYETLTELQYETLTELQRQTHINHKVLAHNISTHSVGQTKIRNLAVPRFQRLSFLMTFIMVSSY